jgi:hypothetical protein
MNLEDKLKETFMKHAEDVKPDAGSWDGVETKLRRAHYARVVMVSTLTVAAIAAVAIVLPQLRSTKTPRSGFTSPTATQEPSPTASPTPAGIDTTGWSARVGTQSDFSLLIPPDWKGGWFEGYWDFEPNGLPGLPEGGNTFAVEVHVESGNYQSFAQEFAAKDTIGGRKTLWWQKSDTKYSYAIQWTDCSAGRPDCSPDTSERTLLVDVSGSTAALWQKYKATGLKVVDTIAVYDGSTPAHGTLAAGTSMDAYTRAMVRFMDARAEGIGAEEEACCNASEKMDMFYSVGTLDLSGWKDLGGRTSAASAAAVTFRVEVIAGQGTETSRHVEDITVGYESGRQSDAETPVVIDMQVET